MLSEPPSSLPPSPFPRQQSAQADIAGLVERCMDQTAEALIATRTASPAEVAHGLDDVRRALVEDRPLDLLEAVARRQGHDEEHLSTPIRALGEQLASTMRPFPQLIPFASKLIAPSAFYESFEHLHKAARALLVPVIFVEDTDSIGVASVNPIAASLFAATVQLEVSQRFDIRPFVTIVRLNYESWTFLTRKHFEL